MPRHANSTSFRKGFQRPTVSILRQKATIRTKLDAGEWHKAGPKIGGKPDRITNRPCEYCRQIYTPTSQRQKWCKNCVPDKYHRRIMQRYGLNKDALERLLQSQSGICALCPQPATDVDHDHTSGRIRGLVCTGCNLKLAALDDILWREKAEAYRAVL